MERKFTLFVVDDHEMFRDGIKFVLSQNEKIDVIGEAVNGIEFLNKIQNKQPDLVLMDIDMPEMNGVEATRKALTQFPNMKIIALTMFGEQEYYFDMVHAGIKGFILKKSGKKELEAAIDAVINDDNYFSNELLRGIIFNMTGGNEKSKNEQLTITRREADVLNLICKGMSNNEIAEKLNISPKTVDGHRTNLLAKTNSKNSISLVMFAIKNKWIDI